MTDKAYPSPPGIAPDLASPEAVAREFASPGGRTALKRAGASIAAGAVGLYMFGALLTYRADDPSLNVATDERARNLFGAPGALIADLLMQTIGFAAFAAAVALLCAGATRIVRKRLTRTIPRERLLAGVAGVALFSAALAAVPDFGGWPLAAGLGGVFGDGAHGLLAALFSLPGLPAPSPLAGVVAFAGAGAAFGWAFSVRKEQFARAVDAAAGGAAKLAKTAFKRPRARAESDRQDPWVTLRPEAERSADWPPLAGEPARQPLRPNVSAAPSEPDPRPAPVAPAPARAPIGPREGAINAASAGAGFHPDSRQRQQARQQALFDEQPQKRFFLPPLDLLVQGKQRAAQADAAALQALAKQLAAVLADYGVQGEIVSARPGPVVTLFELEPAPGVKSARVIGLAEDIARSMSAERCRVAVIPGRNAIGIELPNAKRETVYLRGILSSTAFVGAQGALPLALGETIEGEHFCADLAKMPHLLIAGTTGSGKSVGINAMILSLLYRHTPEECRFIMIDPKMLELSVYDGIPHLLTPVVTEPKQAVVALKWVVREMEERYRLMTKHSVRNIHSYNERIDAALQSGEPLTRTVHGGFDHETGEPIYDVETLPLERMPYIVVVIDEMADLMTTAGREVETAVQRLAQMARAAGIHVIMATQRPSVDVITGVIKANFPTRLAYTVASRPDSVTILGERGAEQLLGQGDCLFLASGGRMRRLHGPYVKDEEIARIVDLLKRQGPPDYRGDIVEDPDSPSPPDLQGDLLDGVGASSGDELFDRAVEIIARDRKASTSYLQRRLNVGYNRAATLIERLEKEGIIGQPLPNGRREIKIAAIAADDDD